MKKRNLLSSLAVLIAALLLCAGASAESVEADTIRFLRAEGEVTIYNPAGQPRFAVANARFGSGEAIETGEDGYAAISLDDTKIVSLDKETRLEFVREGSHMKLTVVRGMIFVDVSEKLDENESLDIETTTLMVGIRGTMIAAGVQPGKMEQVMLLEGKTEITYLDADGTQRQMMLSSGEMLSSKGAAVPAVSPMKRDDIPVFVRKEISQAPERMERAREAGIYGLIEEKPADDTGNGQHEEERRDDWVYPGQVILTAASATKYYDGEPLSRTDDVLVSGLPPEFSILVTSIGSQTEPGTSLNSIAGYAIVDGEGREVNDRFNVRTVNGQLTVNPLPLTIWTGSAEKEYDGTPLTCEDVRVTAAQGYTAEQPDWINCAVSCVSDIGAHALCAASGNIQVYLTDPFTGEPAHLELPAGKRLTVSVREVNGTKTFCYDITEMSEKDIPEDILRLYARNPEMMALACEAAGWDLAQVREMAASLPAAGSANVEAAGMDMPEGVASRLIVDSVDVRVIADSDGKDYNGRSLGTEEAKYYPVRLPEITVTATGTITLPGSCDNTYEIRWGEGVDPDHYVIYEELGTLTVTEPAAGKVFLQAGSAERPYDGTPLTSNEVDMIGLPEGYTWKAGTEGSRTEAGTGANAVSWYSIYSPDGEDVTEQFGGMVRLLDGTLTVTPAVMEITTGSASREYDGSPLTNSEATVSGLAGGETVTVTAAGAITDVGTAENTCVIDWGETHPENYAVKMSLGTLEVTPNTGTVTFTVDPITKAYDGLPLRVSTAVSNSSFKAGPRRNSDRGGLTVHVDGLPEGLTFEARAFCDAVHPGTYIYSITVIIRDPSGREVTDYFTGLAVQEGEVTIEPAQITVTTGSAEKEYDGTPLTCAEAVLTGLVNGETADAAATGSLTGVGTADNTFVISWGTADPADYTVIENLGTLTVTANDTAIAVTAASAEKVYDGTALTADGFTVENLPAGFTLTATVSGSRTDAGTGENTVTDYTILDAENSDVTASFTGVTTVKGELKVTERTITINTESLSYARAYNGEPISPENTFPPTVTGEFAAGDVLSDDSVVSAYDEQIDAGDVEIGYKINWTDEAKAGNYSITLEPGTLTVKPLDVTFDLGCSTEYPFEYNGEPQGCEWIEATLGDGTEPEPVDWYDGGEAVRWIIYPLVGEDRVKLSWNCYADVGTYTLGGIEQFLSGDSGNYNIQYRNNTVKIAEAEITFRAVGEDERIYNGEPAYGILEINPERDWEEIGGSKYRVWLTETDVVIVTITGGGTDADEYELVCSYEFESGEESNYKITTENGTQTVTKAAITVTAPSAEKVYDGTALTADGLVPAVDGLPDGFEVACTYSGSQTDAGSSDSVVETCKVMKGGEDVTANFNITTKPGTLTVTNAKITVTAPSAEKVYDGTALTADGLVPAVEGLPDGFEVACTYSGSQTDAGSSDSVVETCKVTKGGADVTTNFNITTKPGTLTVTTAKIAVTADSDEKVYDGMALEADSVTVTGLGDDFDYTSTVEGSRTEAGKGDNIVTSFTVWYEGNDVTTNFDVTTAKGTLTVTKAAITVTAPTPETKTYDGTALTADDLDPVVTPTLREVFTVVCTYSGSQTDVGSSYSEIAACVVMKDGEDVTANFDITTAKGTLTVTERNVTISTEELSYTREYNGYPIQPDSTNPPKGIENFVEGEVESLESTYEEQTDVGEVQIGYKVNWSGEGKPGNYNITLVPGTLKVTGRNVTISTEELSYAREYDGNPIQPDSTDPPTGIENFVEGEVESLESTYAEQTDVGSVQIGYKVNWIGEGKPGNYNITLVPGTLTVKERNVTVYAGGGNFEYSGTVLLPNPDAYFTENDEWLDVDIAEGIDTVTAVIRLIGGDRLTLVCRGYKELGTGYEVIESETFTGNSGNYNITYKRRIMNILIEVSTDDPYPDD